MRATFALAALAFAVVLGAALADGASAQVRERERGNIAVTADVVDVDARGTVGGGATTRVDGGRCAVVVDAAVSTLLS